jgi:hypothetical protein
MEHSTKRVSLREERARSRTKPGTKQRPAAGDHISRKAFTTKIIYFQSLTSASLMSVHPRLYSAQSPRSANRELKSGKLTTVTSKPRQSISQANKAEQCIEAEFRIPTLERVVHSLFTQKQE